MSSLVKTPTPGAETPSSVGPSALDDNSKTPTPSTTEDPANNGPETSNNEDPGDDNEVLDLTTVSDTPGTETTVNDWSMTDLV